MANDDQLRYFLDQLSLPLSYGKARKVETLVKNAERGRIAEDDVRFLLEWRFSEVVRTGIGHDFMGIISNPYTGDIIDFRYFEVKTNNARLSPRQEECRARLGDRYKVIRLQRPDILFD